VRGIDRFGHFARAPRPDGEMTPATLALHNASAERSARILDRGTGVATFNDPDAIRG
jgi:hypothetical protein